jgi:hypothetical protein
MLKTCPKCLKNSKHKFFAGAVISTACMWMPLKGSADTGILLTNGPADRCRGSYYPMGRQIGALDPTVPPIGPADRCHGSYYPMGRRIGALDPTTQWAVR